MSPPRSEICAMKRFDVSRATASLVLNRSR